MAEVIVDRYVIETQEAQKNLQAVNNSLTEISNKSKKTSAQMNTDFTNAARGGAALTKQYNGLNLAVSQFARELPNAAQSAQIFFMSIGNNFGQLQDALSRINAQNKELAAQGQKTIPVFKQMASAIFSLNSLINVGVLFLVLYGKEIGNLISSLFKGRAAFDAAKESFKLLNAAFDSKSVIGAINNVRELQKNIELARTGFLSQEAVLLQYNQTIGKTTGEVTSLDKAEQALIDNGRAYVQMMLYKAAANAALEESTKKALEAEKLRNSTDLGSAGIVGGILNPFDPTAAATAQAAATQRQIKEAEKQSAGLLDIFNKFQQKAADIAERNGLDFLGNADTLEANRKKAQQKAIEDLREFWRLYELEAEKVRPSRLQPTTIDGSVTVNNDLRASTADIPAAELSVNELLGRLFEARKKGQTDYTKFLEAELKRRVDAVDKAAAEEEKINKQVLDAALDLQQQLSDGIFGLRMANAQAAADEELRLLDEQRETTLDNDKLTADQREQIENDFDQKRAAILNKNAATQRQLELTQILINTALATISELARGGPIAAAAAAAAGALAYAFASSQPLPKFAKGTERVIGGERGKDSVHALLMPDEAVITANENMRHPGLAKAWNSGKLEQFLAMKYIEPMLSEVYSKDAAKINNQFINNNKVSGINDKRIVKGLQENANINRLMLKQMMKSNINITQNKRLWN